MEFCFRRLQSSQRILDWLKLPFSLLNRVKFNLNLLILEDNFNRQNIDKILNINVKQLGVIFLYKKFLINGSGGPERKNWESLQIRKEIWSENLDVTRRHRKNSKDQLQYTFINIFLVRQLKIYAMNQICKISYNTLKMLYKTFKIA